MKMKQFTIVLTSITICLVAFTSCNKADVAELILSTSTSISESETKNNQNTTNGQKTMSTQDYQTLNNLDDAIQASQNQTVFLFKHSNACPISAAAKKQMDQFIQEHETPVYMVVVQHERPMSNQIAEHFDVKHESPQLLVVNQGKVDSVFNHYEIRNDHILDDLKTKTN